MKIIPLADRVIVEPAEENKRTRAGLFIPDVATSQKLVAYGTVLAVGTGRVNSDGITVPLHIKVGDTVCFPRKAPGLIPILDDEGNEKIVLLLREAEIIGTVEGLPVHSTIVDMTGAPLSMLPQSQAKADSSYENAEAIAVAEREGWADINDHVDQPAE